MNEIELFESALQAKKKGNITQAIELFTQVINKYPDSEKAEIAKSIRYSLKEDTNTAGVTVEGNDAQATTSNLEFSNLDSIPSVTVTDIQMPFLSMVVFMVKWVIASIPAFIILYVLFAIGAGTLAGIV